MKERRKPGPGRRSPDTGGGLAFEVGRRESGGRPSGHSSMEGASDRSTSEPLTGLGRRRSFGGVLLGVRESASWTPLTGPAHRDRRRQRLMRTPRPRKTTPRREGPPHEGSPDREPARIGGGPRTPSTRRSACAHRLKPVERRQARHGSDARAGSPARARDAKAPAHRESSDRCRCTHRRSVAEVGEEHLPHEWAGAARRRHPARGSVRRSPESSDGGGAHRSTRTGAEGRRRERISSHDVPHRGRKVAGRADGRRLGSSEAAP